MGTASGSHAERVKQDLDVNFEEILIYISCYGIMFSKNSNLWRRKNDEFRRIKERL